MTNPLDKQEAEDYKVWLHRALGEIVLTLDEHEPEGVAVALEDIAAQLRDEIALGITPERRAEVKRMMAKLIERSTEAQHD